MSQAQNDYADEDQSLDQGDAWLDNEGIDDIPAGEIPEGTHRVSMELSVKKGDKDGKPYRVAEVSFTLEETVEMADPEAQPVEPGTTESVSYFVSDARAGKRYRREIYSRLRDAGCAGTTWTDQLEFVNGGNVMATLTCKRRKSSKSDETFLQIVSLELDA